MTLSQQSTYFAFLVVLLFFGTIFGAVIKRVLVTYTFRNRVIAGVIVAVPLGALSLGMISLASVSIEPFPTFVLLAVTFCSAASGGAGIPILTGVALFLLSTFVKIPFSIVLGLLVAACILMLVPEKRPRDDDAEEVLGSDLEEPAAEMQRDQKSLRRLFRRRQPIPAPIMPSASNTVDPKRAFLIEVLDRAIASSQTDQT